MFTVAGLRSQADQLSAVYEELLKKYPPRTYHEGRNDAHAQMEVVRICAAWLESKGLAEAKHVGPFMAFKLKRGQRVRLLKGAIINGTGNAIPREGQINARPRIFTVHDFNAGYVDRFEDSQHPKVVQARVTWVGAGGYWRWTDIDNVELIEEPVSA
jgi:hypothetical protein